MRNLLLALLACAYQTEAQTVSTFMETTTGNCYGLTVEDGYLYAVDSFTGRVHRKAVASTDADYETFTVPGSGYTDVCKIGDYVYLSKPFNGNYGIHRFDITQPVPTPEFFLPLTGAVGLAHKGNALFINTSVAVYRVDVAAGNTPEMIATPGSDIGMQVVGDYLYMSGAGGITRIELTSGTYQKETVSTHAATGLALADAQTIYLTRSNTSSVYQLMLPSQELSPLVELENFIGTLDIVYAGDFLFVTTLEGDYNKIAKIDLSALATPLPIPPQPTMAPNPASDHVTLSQLEAGHQVQVYDLLGRTVPVLRMGDRLDVSPLAPGLYLVQVGDWCGRLVKR